MNNRLKYIGLKMKMIGSRYMCKNLPLSSHAVVCDKCGGRYDYRYAPIIIDELFEQYAGELGKKARLCDSCMEKMNGGKFNISQLKPCQISLNYAFCNDLDVGCEGGAEALEKMHECCDKLIEKYENVDESQWENFKCLW